MNALLLGGPPPPLCNASDPVKCIYFSGGPVGPKGKPGTADPAFTLKQTAWEKRNPSQPWYRRFDKKKRS